MKNIFCGIITGFFLVAAVAYLFLVSGGIPVATKGPALPLEHFISKTAMHAAMKNELNVTSPILADEVNLLAGAKIYTTNCATCHGTLNGTETAIARGLFPKPPQLLKPDDGVTDDPVGEIYWKVRNGIRLTGMPGYVDSLKDTELWQVSQLLLNAGNLPDSVKNELK